MIKNARTKWGPALHRFGHKYDHGLLSVTWRWKTKKTQRFVTADFKAMNSQSWREFDKDLRIRMPNTVINGIHLHRFPTSSSTSPPMPKCPPRDIPLPTGFDDAVYGPYAQFWRPAIQKEIDSLFKYGVWRLERLPPGALVLPCVMVFKIKPDGNDPPGISKFKCRY